MKKGKAGEETNRYLDVHAIKSDAFFNWDAFEDRFYKKRISGISKYHYFGFTDKALQLKTTVNCTEVKEYELCKLANKATDQQKEAWITDLRSSFPDAEPVPCLALIKQCELYLKWRPFVPDQFKDEICPEPPKEVMDKVKREKNAKVKIKKEAMAKIKDSDEKVVSI